ncbi:EamA family transporter [Bacillus sp. JJ664]
MVKSYLFLLICVVCWGSNFVFGAILVKAFSPMFLAVFRLFFIAMFMIIYGVMVNKWKRIQKKDWFMIFLLGLIGTCFNQWSFYAALETAHPTTSALILALAPITTSLLASIFLKESLTKQFCIGSIVALIGVILVITNGKEIHLSIGLVWIFITMLTFAISIIMIKKLTEKYHSITISLYSNIIGFGSLLPFLATEKATKISIDILPWILLIVTAILMHGICTLIWNHQIQVVGASKAAMFLNLEPFIAMLVGLIILKNNVSISQLSGGLLIIIGVILSTSMKLKKEVGEQLYSQKS